MQYLYNYFDANLQKVYHYIIIMWYVSSKRELNGYLIIFYPIYSINVSNKFKYLASNIIYNYWLYNYVICLHPIDNFQANIT